MKYLLWCISILAFISPVAYADELEKLQIDYQKNIYFEDTLSIDISPIVNEYEETLGQQDLIFEWDVTGTSSTQGTKLEQQFETPGTKKVSLNIFAEIENEKTLLGNSLFEVFVYEKSLPFIFSDTISQNQKDDFKSVGKNSNVYIYDVLNSSEKDLYGKNVMSSLEKYYSGEKGKSDYVGIWGEKEFLFSVISKINKEQENNEKQRNINFLLVSSFNGNILKGYLGNLLTNKDYISNSVIINDALTFQIVKSPSSIETLQLQLEQNQYEYINIDTQTSIHKLFFISRFINILSNSGINTSDIFILIMIPLLLTLVSFIKHFIGISPIGIIIPLFLSILFYKIGVIFTVVIIVILFITNLIVAKGINKYNLLYTPKISFLVTVNIIVFFGALEYILRNNILSLGITDIVYVILFIIVAEKMITVIISKELREYKRNLLGTFLVSFLCFMVLEIAALQVFILAYPELIIICAPLSFLIGRFTGLRVTEYLRFKEIIKNIEE